MSWGNSWNEVDFDINPGLSLLCGKNGHGKCLSPDTIVEIEIENETLYNDFFNFINQQNNK